MSGHHVCSSFDSFFSLFVLDGFFLIFSLVLIESCSLLIKSKVGQGSGLFHVFASIRIDSRVVGLASLLLRTSNV